MNPGIILGEGLDNLGNSKFNYIEKVVSPRFWNIRRFGFQHHYMSGMVFKHNLINFGRYYEQLNQLNFGFLSVFPHVSILNDFLQDKNVIYTDTIFYRSREIGLHETNLRYLPSEWISPNGRITQFEADCSYINYYLINKSSSLQKFFLISWRYRISIGEIYRFKLRILNKKWVKYFKLDETNETIDYIAYVRNLNTVYSNSIPKSRFLILLSIFVKFGFKFYYSRIY